MPGAASNSRYSKSSMVLSVFTENSLITTPPSAATAGAVMPVRRRAAVAAVAETTVRRRKGALRSKGGHRTMRPTLCETDARRNPLECDAMENAACLPASVAAPARSPSGWPVTAPPRPSSGRCEAARYDGIARRELFPATRIIRDPPRGRPCVPAVRPRSDGSPVTSLPPQPLSPLDGRYFAAVGAARRLPLRGGTQPRPRRGRGRVADRAHRSVALRVVAPRRGRQAEPPRPVPRLRPGRDRLARREGSRHPPRREGRRVPRARPAVDAWASMRSPS